MFPRRPARRHPRTNDLDRPLHFATHQPSLAPEDIPLDIIHEDGEIIVVNKPAGMVIHPAAGVRDGTLANALAFHFDQLSTRAGALRPGIVHRLDRGTSGIVVVAKTATAHEHLADQFRAREVFKSYVALVHGLVAREARDANAAGGTLTTRGRIEEPIGRDPRHRTRMAVMRGGRTALTLYRARRWFERFTLLDVEIKTGRTHQIRVHLAWLKHPVVGDEVYGGGRDQNVHEPRFRALIRTLNRQFLHAEQIGFRHPRTGDYLRFNAPLPPELAGFLEALEAG
ncbi:MAG: RluA family pseudouridine synthase [Acidobacteria bacterium]|nr:RluA family pseudouridine synthase [Acidobacteriota bacterium]